MVVNGRPLKRMKRRVTADLNDFLTFPSGEQTPTGPFRTTVREFLLRHALLPPPSSLLPNLLTWQILFRVGERSCDGNGDGDDVTVCMDVVEEDVVRSRSVYCDQCRVVGWSGNPVCGKRYHFIIKSDGASIGGYNKPCAGCGASLHLSDSRCKSCNHVMTNEDIEDWMYNQLDDTNHLLHGVVHVNGFGHILRVNGREGGSRVLSGTNIMDFWDRICKVLGVRQVSVMDVSKKYGLEFRLLHSVVKGNPWYGNWGYQFGAGSYAITHEAYDEAIETLANIPLSTLSTSQGRKPRTHLQDLIAFYQSLSERELVTSRDLFSYLTTLIHDANKNRTMLDLGSHKKAKLSESRVLCVWNMSDIIRVEEAMFRVLKAVSGSSWVSWRSLRGAVCRVGRPELLDYCLKELKGKQAADGMVVNARSNPDSGALEYRLEPGNSHLTNSTNKYPIAICPSEDHLLRDLRYLYEALLHPQSMINHIPITKRNITINAAMKILDCKQFVKNYHPEPFFAKANPHSLILSCRPELTEQTEENTVNPPPEHIILPDNATLHDLKIEASKAFQEVYLILRRFQAEELVGYRGVDESTQIKLLIGPKIETVSLRGKCLGKNGLNRYRMERGEETWSLDCSCGAKDDDGERMLACDVCGVWQHTRCAGIPDCNMVPVKFVCRKCDDGSGGGDMVEASDGMVDLIGDGGGSMHFSG